jgi:hypothetical protein
MTHSSSLGHQETGRTSKVIFLPPRYYKPKAEWTEEDWKEDWTERVRHRRSVKHCRTWQEGRDHVLGTQASTSENLENQDYRGLHWVWILFFGLCFLIIVLVVLFGHVQPVIDPALPYKMPGGALNVFALGALLTRGATT